MNARNVCLVILNSFCATVLFGTSLPKQDQEKLRKVFLKGQESFLICPYLEGSVNGLTLYNIRANASPELKSSWRASANPGLRLVRGDRVIIERVNARGDCLELLIKTIKSKTFNATPRERALLTVFLGLPGMAAEQGEFKLQPDVKLRFFGNSADEIQAMVCKYLSSEQPTIDLKPGCLPTKCDRLSVTQPKL